VDLAHMTPAQALPMRPQGVSKCRFAVLATDVDEVVPSDEAAHFRTALQALQDRYEVAMYDRSDAVFCGSTTHSVMAVRRPDEYRAKLCRFWSETFSISPMECGLVGLPHFGMDVAASPGWKEAPAATLFG